MQADQMDIAAVNLQVKVEAVDMEQEFQAAVKDDEEGEIQTAWCTCRFLDEQASPLVMHSICSI